MQKKQEGGQQVLKEVEEEQGEEKTFDDLCEELKKLRDEKEWCQDRIKALDDDIGTIEGAIMEAKNRMIRGKKWDAELVESRRRIGKPALPELERLLDINDRFVRTSPPEITIYIKEKKKNAVIKFLEFQGVPFEEKEASMKPETVAQVRKVLKETPALNRQAKEIWELLDVKIDKELKIFPSIMGDITE